MDLIKILQEDYQNFPHNQTYTIYDQEVYFKDPLNQFNGIKKYQKMIDFINRYFLDIHLDLHQISQSGETIETRWTLHWKAPFPWKPPIQISGWSELKINSQGLIHSHIDYWEITPWDVLKQLFFPIN